MLLDLIDFIICGSIKKVPTAVARYQIPSVIENMVIVG